MLKYNTSKHREQHLLHTLDGRNLRKGEKGPLAFTNLVNSLDPIYLGEVDYVISILFADLRIRASDSK